MWSEKTDCVVSLDNEDENHTSTASSWEYRQHRGGLYQGEKFPKKSVQEQAVYGLWSANF